LTDTALEIIGDSKGYIFASVNIGEEVVNHIKPGVIGVYNKYRYDNEKKEALLKWETLLLEILAIKESISISASAAQ
jgi:hypothetical protein